MKHFDYIVVGSGCSGAMAAQTLVEAGKQVAVVDVGEWSPNYQTLIPNKDFLTLRESDPDQYKYFIGDNAKGVVINDTGKGAQITPNREHMLRHTGDYIPLRSKTFDPIESLGYGGLGIGWGLQCWEFSRQELAATGMDADRMIKAYDLISDRIGISGTRDDAAPYTLGKLTNYQPSPDMDRNMRKIHAQYIRHKQYFKDHGIYLGRTPLALITENKGNRKKYPYRDMDFYDDNTESAWRPWITINALRTKDNFTYISDFLATNFSETPRTATIHGIDPHTKKAVAFSCNKLILATGALGSARIALRSQGKNGTRTPFLCNPYTYVPCIQPSMFGAGREPRKIGFGQLSAFLSDENVEHGSSILTLYSYQSLMLFRIIRQAPLNFSDARPLMQYLSSGLVVTGIQHSDAANPDKYLTLQKDAASLTGDALFADYHQTAEELAAQRTRENRYISAIRRTGLFAVERMNPGNGSSVHYAGTLPYADQEKPLTLDSRGKLHGTRAVYVADSSGYKYLPARGLTFSILANAHLTAENVLEDGNA